MEMGRQSTFYNRDVAWWDGQQLIAAQCSLRLRCRVLVRNFFISNLYRNSDLTYEGLGVRQNHVLGSRDEDHWQFRMSGKCLCQIDSLVWVESCTIGHEGEAASGLPDRQLGLQGDASA